MSESGVAAQRQPVEQYIDPPSPVRNLHAVPPVSDDRRRWAGEINTMMADLPDMEASALRLKYNHQLPPAEAAAWLNVTVDEYRAALGRGLVGLGHLIAPPP